MAKIWTAKTAATWEAAGLLVIGYWLLVIRNSRLLQKSRFPLRYLRFLLLKFAPVRMAFGTNALQFKFAAIRVAFGANALQFKFAVLRMAFGANAYNLSLQPSGWRLAQTPYNFRREKAVGAQRPLPHWAAIPRSPFLFHIPHSAFPIPHFYSTFPIPHFPFALRPPTSVLRLLSHFPFPIPHFPFALRPPNSDFSHSAFRIPHSSLRIPHSGSGPRTAQRAVPTFYFDSLGSRSLTLRASSMSLGSQLAPFAVANLRPPTSVLRPHSAFRIRALARGQRSAPSLPSTFYFLLSNF